jgi:DNA-directed RNA polymerase specialized sigma24 family protein
LHPARIAPHDPEAAMAPPEDLHPLLTDAKDGDVEALTALVAALEVRLLPFVRSGLTRRGVLDPGAAEEVVQETVIRLVRVLPTWDPVRDRSGMNLPLTIANHLTVDHLRRAGHEVQCDACQEAQARGDGPADEVVRGAEVAALHDALAALPDDIRAVLTAHFYEGQPLSALLRERGRDDYQWFYHHEYLPALKQLRERLGPWFPEYAGARRQAHG